MKVPLLPIKFYHEVEVQQHYVEVLKNLLKCDFSAKFRTDGLFDSKKYSLKLLAEFKTAGDLIIDKNILNRCIIQNMCYIKKVEDGGEKLPDLIFVGTGSHFSIFESILLADYLHFVNSSMIPRNMFDNPPPELMKILSENLHVPKYSILDLPLLENIIENYKGESGGLKMSINTNNIVRIYENFIMSDILVSKLDENEQVALFASIIFDECYNIERKPDQIVTPLENKKIIKINRDNYDEFLISIKSIEKVSEKSEIISQADRLIKEVSRRFHGEFYTPKIWVDEAHRMIEQEFGINWKDEYVVWDPACGTGNLTRDYIFKELYISTLNQSDIDIINQRGYNNEAVKFQYDFLNDDVYPVGVSMGMVENKLQKLAPGLVKALEENRKILIIFNPPYGSSGELRKVDDKKIKGGIAKNSVNKLMLSDNMSRASLQLYAQFLYRIMLLSEKNKNISLCMFIPPAILGTSSFKNFREKFFNYFKFIEGIIFNAGYFSNVKDGWPVSLIIMKPGQESRNNFDFTIKDIDKQSNIVSVGVKNIYNSDKVENAAIWARKEIKGIKFTDAPRLRNAIEVADDGRMGKMCPNALGFIYYSGNVVYESALRVSIFSTTSSVEYNGFPITLDNFYKVLSIFTARKSTILKWFNTSDEYLKPNEQHYEYPQWNLDCIVYSLFNGASSQSSLRNIIYKQNSCNIENQFFWLPNEMMKQLADDAGFDEMYQDATVFNQDRFVFQELQKVQLSPDAKAVLDKATDLVIKSILERKRLHDLHPEWHLNAWDAGWYQIKLVLKKSFKDDHDEFVTMYKEFENRMREGVYKFGFLK